MDEELQNRLNAWKISNNSVDGAAYLLALLRSGFNVDLSQYPMEVLQIFFQNIEENVADIPNITIQGISLVNIVEAGLSHHRRLWANTPESGKDYQLALVWYPQSAYQSLPSIFCAFQVSYYLQYPASLVEVTDEGELDTSRLDNFADLNPGYPSDLNIEKYLMELVVNLQTGNTIQMDIEKLADANLQEILEPTRGSVIILNQIDLTLFPRHVIPTLQMGPCEDYPACGHDICPPFLGGIQVANVCTCGRFIPRHSSSSLCRGCLRGPGSEEDEFGYTEDFDQEDYEDEEDEDLRENPIDSIRGRVVEINGKKWEVRAREFIFPPPPLQVGEVRVIRELTEEEKIRKRYYIDIRATPYIENLHEYYNFERDIPIILIPSYRILFEILGGALTMPRLPEWRKHRAKSFYTDIEHFLNYRPATGREVQAFLEIAEDTGLLTGIE